MRISGPRQIVKQRMFSDFYDKTSVDHSMLGFGFFPRELLEPLCKHLFENISVGRAVVAGNKELNRLLASSYYFNKQMVWDEESLHDGYYTDLRGNHIYFKIIFAEKLGEENVVPFGMLDRNATPKDLQNFVRRVRRGARAANKEMFRLIEEFYKLPVGVAHRVYGEYRDFFKVALKYLNKHGYHRVHSEESAFIVDIKTPAGSVFMRNENNSVGKIWFSHQGYTHSWARPGPITLDIMFEDPEIAGEINQMARETYRWIILNDLNLVGCGEELIMQKLQGDKEEFEYGCPIIEGFEYLI